MMTENDIDCHDDDDGDNDDDDGDDIDDCDVDDDGDVSDGLILTLLMPPEGLATDLSHSSEHEDLLSQIIIRSSLNTATINNNNHHQGHELPGHKVKQLERAFMIPIQKSVEEMKRLSHSIGREEFLTFMEEAKRGKYLTLRREYEVNGRSYTLVLQITLMDYNKYRFYILL